jgi:dihydrodipicolinate synthase/N-acetylneuraminate lyase
VLYNVPGRTSVSLSTTTILQLAGHPNIRALKQAVPDLELLNVLLYQRPPGFFVLSGEDALAFPMIAMGADGVISVTSNVAPSLMSELVDAAMIGDRDRAMTLQAQLVPLMKAMFLESNPIPVKYALAQLQLIQNVLRMPLDCLSPEWHEPVRQAMEISGMSLARQSSAASVNLAAEVYYV